MSAVFRIALIVIVALFAAPAVAQKTTVPQEHARPGESTEPPRPRAAPVGSVQLHALPRGGGVLVFGGAGGIGFDVAKTLVTQHVQVTVVVKEVDKHKDLTESGITVAQADLQDPETLKPVFTSAPFRAVVSALPDNGRAFEDNKAVVDVMKAVNVQRLILLSSVGAGDSAPALPWYVKIMTFFGSKDLGQKTMAEDYVKSAGLEHVIMRAGDVMDKSAGGTATITPDASVYSLIARADLVKLVAAAIDDDTLVGKTVSAIDPARVGFLARFQD